MKRVKKASGADAQEASDDTRGCANIINDLMIFWIECGSAFDCLTALDGAPILPILTCKLPLCEYFCFRSTTF